ncbi:MAG: glutathione peroxidase [Clostridia bacterium]|nr:glutathione peroxidase [Clostridia bacterium]
MSIYDFSVKTMDSQTVSLADYKGKVLIIVNTATGCGFTPQYDELQDLYELHKKDGLEILDFPCNQFMGQAPGDDEEIHSFCTGRYGITFPQFSKIEVLGENADPLFKYLSENTRFAGFGKGIKAIAMNGIAKKMDKNFKDNGNIKWNFTKFLIARDGSIAGRFEPTDSMDELKRRTEELL